MSLKGNNNINVVAIPVAIDSNCNNSSNRVLISVSGDGNSYENNRELPIVERVINTNNGDNNSDCSTVRTSKYNSGKWSQEETDRLLAAVELYGPKNWSLIAQTVGTRGPSTYQLTVPVLTIVNSWNQNSF